jgi:hypothetical protein
MPRLRPTTVDQEATTSPPLPRALGSTVAELKAQNKSQIPTLIVDRPDR